MPAAGGRYRNGVLVSGVADLAGRTLAGRYRLLAPVGTGASGRVYLADDTRLRRRVAVKVLHTALADDSGFLRRFRAEAQVAASLHHQNIMTVHDWGDDGVPFMVLELLSGGSLRGLLDAGTRLTPAQAARVGRQVASALDYAHRRGLVHRDVKPANLLFDEHGVVRVADFGLARALAEASWTEPAGAVLGTARYASPEQARGARLDGRGDLYSLALVLIEAVTGDVPFVADTPITTLLARTQGRIVAPPELGALGPVVERAGQADPADRYPDAGTMAAALADVEAALPPPRALRLAGLGGGGHDPDPTHVVGSRAPAVFDQDAATRPDPVFDQDAVTDRGDAYPPFADEIEILPDRPAPAPGPTRDPAPVAATAPARSPRLRPSRALRSAGVRSALVVVLVVVLAVAGAVWIAAAPRGPAAPVPNLVGMARDGALARASDAGFGVKTSTRAADDPAGTVLAQEPAAGSWLGKGGSVRLVLSSGPPLVAVPEVAGRPEKDATAALGGAGFAVETSRRHDEEVPAGTVLGTEPSGRAPRDGLVTLVVSDGPAPVKVPDVAAGHPSYDDAADALRAVRLTPSRVDEFSDSVDEGRVIRTEPAAGQLAPRDSEVKVVVSKGPELVTVPDVRHLSLDAAFSRLESVGLQASVQGLYWPGRKVKFQDPEPGTKARPGSQVQLYL